MIQTVSLEYCIIQYSREYDAERTCIAVAFSRGKCLRVCGRPWALSNKTSTGCEVYDMLSSALTEEWARPAREEGHRSKLMTNAECASTRRDERWGLLCASVFSLYVSAATVRAPRFWVRLRLQWGVHVAQGVRKLFKLNYFHIFKITSWLQNEHRIIYFSLGFISLKAMTAGRMVANSKQWEGEVFKIVLLQCECVKGL